MKVSTCILFIGLLAGQVFGQTEDAWVYLKDKPNNQVYFADPLIMLSHRAMDRRERFGIALDMHDVPVDQSYIDNVRSQAGITVLAKSKWLNALHVQGSQADIQKLKDLEFVLSIEYVDNNLNTSSKPSIINNRYTPGSKFSNEVIFDYGKSTAQIEMLGVQELHHETFLGEDMQIAVMDAGFPGVDTMLAFDRLRSNQQLLGGYNFVDRNKNYFVRSTHGTSVLSTMAGFLDGEYVGSAPEADYYLFITEDNSREVPLEESLWVEAAEMADSLGVDIINTSLGYSVFFDDDAYNYTYDEMDGNTAFISRGARMAFSRGMILVNSAGNEGNDPWKYINAPADVAEVLSVGAVDGNEQIAAFSSFGPTADGRIKPDALAQGAGVQIINLSDNVVSSNGTSFSGPLLAGAVACLWQALPDKSNLEILQLIRASGHLAENPTDQEGYGIPDLAELFSEHYVPPVPITEMHAYPNPTREFIHFVIPDQTQDLQFTLYNMLGKNVLEGKVLKRNPSVDVSHIGSGIYMLQMRYSNKEKTIKLIIK